jgi:tetratricopeptide (TPR) repeat protein
MAKSKKSSSTREGIESVENTLSRTERFIEENSKYFVTGLVVVLVVVLGVVGYVRYIRAPHIQQAWEESYKAEFYFEKDSFNLALYGDGMYLGFLDIIDDYSGTPMGNAARYYAGVCFMRLGDYNEAINYLNKFKSDDPLVGAMSKAIIADANVELGNYDEAIKYYLEAVEVADNEFLSPAFLMKAAAIYEIQNDYSAALEVYHRIDKDFYGTTEQQSIEKYIKKAELLSAK